MGSQISVIVPVYNIREYLEGCIRSIMAQTYSRLEVILVDDGSCDGSETICDDYAKMDKRIRVIHKKNAGVAAARRTGLAVASGEYIGFVDGDDRIKPDMYRILLAAALETNADFVNMGYVANGVKTGNNSRMLIQGKKERMELLKDALNYKRIMPGMWSKIYKAPLIRKAYQYVDDMTFYGEDMVALCASILMSENILLLDENLYEYTVRERSLSHEYGADKIKYEINLYHNLLRLFQEREVYLEVEDPLNHYLLNQMASALEKAVRKDFAVQRFEFGGADLVQNKKVVIYGAGRVGRDYFAQISRYATSSIVGWIDRNKIELNDPYIRIGDLEQLKGLEYDMVILAVRSETTAMEIKDDLIEAGILADKIYWREPISVL